MTLTLLEFLNETQSPEPLIWDYVSPSRLNLWMKCPLAFRRKYIDGIETPSSPSLFVGKVTHDVLDGIYRCAMVGAYTTADDVPQFVDDAWNRIIQSEPCHFDDADHETKCRNQVADLVKTYLAETDITSEKPMAVEQKYEVPLIDPLTGEDLGIPLVGVVDLVLDGEDGPIVVDFKTAASASYCDLTHELQLTAYSYLIRETLGRDESALEVRQLVKTKTPKIVTHRFPPRTDEHFGRFFGLVREYLDALDRKVFNYRPSWNCLLCDHSGLCVQSL
jgi:hypothetical protein